MDFFAIVIGVAVEKNTFLTILVRKYYKNGLQLN